MAALSTAAGVGRRGSFEVGALDPEEVHFAASRTTPPPPPRDPG
jgi:hypothetical protein